MTTPLRPVYDFLIHGHCLATRLLAVTLAKEGEKVLLVDPPAPQSLRLPSNPLFERWRAYLGLKPCLQPAEPQQIITGQSRVEIHGRHSLADELQREVPEDAAALLELLEHWHQSGAELLESLCALPPIIGDLKTRTRFRLKSFTQMTGRRLVARAQQIWPQNLSEEAETLLQTLIEGVASAPLTDMTVAEVYLSAFSALQDQQVDVDRLMPDLTQRFAQFHGQQIAQAQLAQLEYRSDSWQLTTQDQHHIRIGCVVDSQLSPLLPGEETPPRSPILWGNHGALGHPLPPSYRQQLYVSGKPTIHLQLTTRDADAELRTRSHSASPDVDALLGHLFPFRNSSTAAPSFGEPSPCRRQGLLHAVHQRLKQRHEHFVCDPVLQCPRLEGIGDLLLADALHHLL